jgi:hypothetical protein
MATIDFSRMVCRGLLTDEGFSAILRKVVKLARDAFTDGQMVDPHCIVGETLRERLEPGLLFLVFRTEEIRVNGLGGTAWPFRGAAMSASSERRGAAFG